MNPYEAFRADVAREIAALGANEPLKAATRAWMDLANEGRYSYHFEWLGRPIIQYPQDIVAVQELLWHIRPDLVIETGVAHGGSLMLSASVLALLDRADALELGTMLDPASPRRRVIGVDIDVRAHNREAIEAHSLRNYIELIEGSSIEAGVVERVRQRASGFEKIVVILDSNHTHEHVLAELECYAALVTLDSYCVVMDTVVERLATSALAADRPWGPGNNPMTATHAFLQRHPEFQIDRSMDDKLLVSVAPSGYLKRIR